MGNDSNSLTDKSYWDETWSDTRIPVISPPPPRRGGDILGRMIRQHAPASPCAMLEVGGAPGGIAAHFARTLGFHAHILEYSEAGCKKTHENFELLGIDVTVYHRDFFDDLSDLPRFDLVMSHGFIEHFLDLEDVLERHVQLVKPGGILFITVPNFAGLYAKVLARMAPRMLSRHNLSAMNSRNWDVLEAELGMRRLFRGYVGGFYPGALHRCEVRSPLRLLVRSGFKTLNSLYKRLPAVSCINSRLWSCHLAGLYQKPL